MSATLTTPKTTSGGEIIRELVNASDGQGLHFDGAAGSVGFTPPDFGTKFSCEFIVQADSWERYQIMFGFGPLGELQLLSHSSTSYNLAFYDTGFRTFGSTGGLEDGKPHHIVITVDDTACVLYSDGNQVGTATLGGTPNIDASAEGAFGSDRSGSSQFWDGTFYRARFWNKTLTAAEVTASYENATVPFADQYGSQTEKITVAADRDFSGALVNWASWIGTITRDAVSNNADLVAGSSASATGSYLAANNEQSGITSAGKRYRLTMDVVALSSGNLNVVDNTGVPIATIASATGTAKSVEFVSSNTNFLGIGLSVSSATATIDNVALVEIGCVSDYDLAFANPTQSLMVQDRAGAADGTSSATGVVQVTPIEQLNSKSARIGTSAATPADGDLLVSGKVGVGVAVPQAIADLVEIYPDSGSAVEGLQLLIRGGQADLNPVGDSIGIGFGYGNANDYIKSGIISEFTSTTGRSDLHLCTTETAGAATVTKSDAKLTISSTGNVTVQTDQNASTILKVKNATDGTAADAELRCESSGSLGLITALAPSYTTSNAYVADSFLVLAASTCSGGLGLAAEGANEINLWTNNAKRVTVDSAGVTKIKTDGTDEMGGSLAFAGLQVSKADGSKGGFIGYDNDESLMSLMANGASGGINFFTHNGSSWGERMRIGTTGNVSIGGAAGASSSNLQVHETGSGDCLIVVSNDTTTIGDTKGFAIGLEADEGAMLMQREANRLNLGTSGVARINIAADGLTTVYKPGWPLKNELPNSGFDVWSNSTLCNPTTGAAPVLGDAGDLITDGTFSDTANWPTQNTGWAVTGGQAVATSAASSYAVGQTIPTTVVGKLYQVQIVVSGYSAGGIYVHQFDGVSASPTISANGTHTFTCEMLTAFTSFQIRASGTTTLDVDSVTFHEVTPGCVNTSSHLAMDGWWKDLLTKCWRQHNDGGTLTHDGSFYATQVYFPAAGYELAQPVANTLAEWTQRFAGRTMTFGCWMKSSNATKVRLSDSDGYTDVAHSDPGEWQWLEVTRTCGASISAFRVVIRGAATETVYVSQPMLVFGSAIGAGNYSKPSGEVVWFEKYATIIDNASGASGGAIEAADDGILNLEALSSGKVPKGCAAVNLAGEVQNTAVTTNEGIRWGRDSTYNSALELNPTVNSMRINGAAFVGCDSNGDIYQKVTESGSTLENCYLNVTAVQLR